MPGESWLHPRITLFRSPLALLLGDPSISLRSGPLIVLLLAPCIAPRVSLLLLNPGIGFRFVPRVLRLLLCPWLGLWLGPSINVLWLALDVPVLVLLRLPWLGLVCLRLGQFWIA